MGYRSSRSHRESESESADDSARDARQDSIDNARLSTARPSDIKTPQRQTDGDSIPSRRHTSQRLRQNQALSKPGSAYDSDRVPDTIHWENYRSIQRSRATTHDTGPAGDTAVPESVRKVVSSPGQSLDASVQRAMEDQMGDSFEDVEVHTGARAASACDDINAKAFTVGNNIAFNSGEYNPSSAEGQHVLAHELAHVRQQTGGAVSMLPKDDVQLEIDPDPELEKEAEETAQRVMQGGKLDIQRLEDTDVHVQRYPGQEKVEAAREMVSDESDDEYSVPADPEVLAQEVEGLKKRQSEMVGFLKEARPGTPVEPDWTKVALKGSYGSLIGSAIGGGVARWLDR